MPFVPVLGVIEATLVFLSNGERCVNTLYFHKDSGSIEATDLTDLTTVLLGFDSTGLDNIRSQDVSLVQIDTRDLSAQDSFINSFPVTGHPGVTVSPAMPNNVTFAVAFRSGLAGRSYRGRNYLVGVAESQVVGNVAASGYIADVVGVYQTLPGLVAAAGFTHVVVSKFSDGAPRLSGVWTEVVQYTCNNVVDSQKRRLPEH